MKDVTHRAVQCNSSSAAVVAVASTGTAMVYAGFKTLALPSSAFAPTLAKLQQQSNRFEVRSFRSGAVSSLLILANRYTDRYTRFFFAASFFRERMSSTSACYLLPGTWYFLYFLLQRPPDQPSYVCCALTLRRYAVALGLELAARDAFGTERTAKNATKKLRNAARSIDWAGGLVCGLRCLSAVCPLVVCVTRCSVRLSHRDKDSKKSLHDHATCHTHEARTSEPHACGSVASCQGVSRQQCSRIPVHTSTIIFFRSWTPLASPRTKQGGRKRYMHTLVRHASIPVRQSTP